MIKLYFRTFIRDRLLCILLLFLWVIHLIYFVYVEQTLLESSPLHYLFRWLKLAPVTYTIFMLISFGYGSRVKQAQLESLSVSFYSVLKHYLFQFILLIAWVIITFLLVTAVYVIRLNGIAFSRLDFLRHILRVTFAFYFLLPALGITLGLFISRIRNRLLGYALLFFALVVSSPAAHTLLLAIYRGTNPVVHAAINLFMLWPDTSWLNEHYGIPVEPVLLWTLMFWILGVMVAFVLRLMQKRRVKIKSLAVAISLVLLIVIGRFALSPASRVMTYSESMLFGGAADQYYYRIYQAEQFEEPSDLVVNRMEINLRIRNELTARVTLQYSGGSDGRQSFTLYHGYQIDSIKNEQGKTVDFSQENDVIELKDDIADEGTLEFAYHGSGNRYYANQQGIFLPAHHVFYPIPGKHKLWLEEAGGLVPVIPDKPMEIMLEADYKGKIICNLPEVSANKFQGSAETITLMAGFYDVIYEDQDRFIIPYLNSNAKEDVLRFKDLRSQPRDSEWMDKLSQASFVAVMPELNQSGSYEPIYISETQVLFDGMHNLEVFGANYDVIPYKSPLMNLLVSFSESKTKYEGRLAIARQMQEMYPAEVHESDQMYLRFEVLREHLSDQALENRIREFLQNDQDTRTIPEFFTELESQMDEGT